MADKLSYTKSISELEEILRLMQSDQCDIDHLAEYTRRASQLIKECRDRLTATEEELQAILTTLQEQK